MSKYAGAAGVLVVLALSMAFAALNGGQRITLRVPKADTPSVANRLLTDLQIADLSIEDPSIEEVIEQVFAGSQPATLASANGEPEKSQQEKVQEEQAQEEQV